MLHLISQSPIELAILERIAHGDAVVCLDNAVLNLLQAGRLSTALTRLLATSRIYVLQTDIALRGIAVEELLSGIEVIGYSELVSLTVDNPHIQSWS